MSDQPGDLELAEKLRTSCSKIRQEIGKVIVGQDEVVLQLLISVFSSGHSLLVGVPGLAKTLMIRTLSESLSLDFARIQFTPDLMPSDITGTEVIQQDRTSGDRVFRFIKGPIFANVILADEINRTPPKTQAALLEAMQERQVTVAGEKHQLPTPFFVLATQNPIEHEGTYPLPEAQLDRFMFQIAVEYPTAEQELEIVRRTTTDTHESVEPQLTSEEIVALTQVVRRVPIADHIAQYGLQIARLSRPKTDEAPDFVKSYVQWGAGPRASQYLVLGAKANALIHGREFVSHEDIRQVALPVLRHRIRTNFSAEAEGVDSSEIIRRLIEMIPTTVEQKRGGLPKIFRS